MLTSQRVAPCSPLLSLLLQAHINVEIVASLATHKYIFKHITKGPDLDHSPRFRRWKHRQAVSASTTVISP
ncbi:hypothetical protein BC828DRAFT_379144 [Blastocladiella britannica]|nr:hypothetical protein BC828DRAFT_379144 [Blastocladiella britannica]